MQTHASSPRGSGSHRSQQRPGDTFGRRRIFLGWGLFLCGLTQLLIAVVYHVNPRGAGTGQADVALSVMSRICEVVGANTPCQQTGHDGDICVDLGRWAAIAAVEIAHVRSRDRSGLLRGVVDDVLSAVLHQSRIVKLGAQVWVHLGAIVLDFCVSLTLAIDVRVRRETSACWQKMGETNAEGECVMFMQSLGVSLPSRSEGSDTGINR